MAVSELTTNAGIVLSSIEPTGIGDLQRTYLSVLTHDLLTVESTITGLCSPDSFLNIGHEHHGVKLFAYEVE